MLHIQCSVIVPRATADVFAYMTAVENEVLWMGPGGLDESGIRPPGPVDVGVRRVEVRKCLGRRIPTTFEVVALEPDRSLSYQTLSGPVIVRIVYGADPIDGERSTRITLAADIVGHGLARALAWVIAGSLRRRFSVDLATLARLLDPAAAEQSTSATPRRLDDSLHAD